ncbi:hypothetical protein EP867_07400 [Falsigemmobacter intermedius]|uniref:Uncharacterized protein n=1 Tax=Falsigemmobacter intermedius TaxID=1553448 RepID=A0A3S3UE99_9RHOB|nr:hypothetical protein EP867_07400 [Falsigemmobacter intermedius]
MSALGLHPALATGAGLKHDRSPLTAHRSPLTAHRSPLTAHRSPLTAHRSPSRLPAWRAGKIPGVTCGRDRPHSAAL